MTSPKKPPKELPPGLEPCWYSDTPEARAEQLRIMRSAQARGSLLFRIARGEDVEADLAELEAQAEAMEALEEEVAEVWVSAAMVGSGGEKRWSNARIGAVILVLALMCGAALAIVWLR
ncbi:hypothetical protein [Sorangium sp. So ce1000]|uniref:hypothetical protein n=1 Tax=Sorangium sp. So ce1000 TaxID=3133325 RepID=UPI003F6429B6